MNTTALTELFTVLRVPQGAMVERLDTALGKVNTLIERHDKTLEDEEKSLRVLKEAYQFELDAMSPDERQSFLDNQDGKDWMFSAREVIAELAGE